MNTSDIEHLTHTVAEAMADIHQCPPNNQPDGICALCWQEAHDAIQQGLPTPKDS